MNICSTEGCANTREKNGTRCSACRNSVRRYGLSVPQRQALLDSQRGLCKICGFEITFDGSAKQSSACVDHDHKTGRVRGILCGNCNTWIGFVENRSIDLDLVKEHIRP